jgi:hypothetical protein
MAVNQNTQQPPIFVIPQQNKDKVIDYAVKAGLLVLLFWGGKKIVQKFKHDKAENAIGTNPAAQQASDLRAALNPSGQRWLWLLDGVQKDAIFNVAKNIKNFKQVIEEYRNLYGDSLDSDLNSKLSPQEYHRFKNTFSFNNADPKNTTSPSGLSYKKGLVIVSKARLNIRKTPRATGSQAKDEVLILGRSNILTTVDKGTAVGITTGRTAFDEKAEPSGVLFIEISVLKTNAAIKDSFTAWIAASQVESITPSDYKQKKYPALSISQEEYDNASSSLNGSDATVNYQKEIITLSPTYILNDKFKVIGEVTKNIILGFPIMELTTPENSYIKFLTIDNTERWVSKKHIKTIDK